MQRIMSFATLAIMGGLGYLFLQGGGLNQIGIDPQVIQKVLPQQSQPQGGQYPASNSWNAQNGSQQTYQPTTNYSATPPPPPPAGSQIPTIGIAAFNIQVFGKSKASKPYVMETLAQIIRQFDIVAIQEIRSQDQYLIPNFVQLINRIGKQHDGKQYSHVIGPRLGYTVSKEQYAFIFNTARIEVDPQSVYTIGDPDGLLHREPLVATFRTRGVPPEEAFTFTLVNIHTDPDDVEKEVDAMADVYRAVRRSSRGEDDIILLGDFNTDHRHMGRLGALPGMLPLIQGVATNTRQTKEYDNIIIHQQSTTEYRGRSGVYDVMRIHNRSLQEALQVSDHFPVWGEFSIYETDAAGRIASRQRTGR